MPWSLLWSRGARESLRCAHLVQVCTMAKGFITALEHLLRSRFLMWSQVPHKEFAVFTMATVFTMAEVLAVAPGCSLGAPGVVKVSAVSARSSLGAWGVHHSQGLFCSAKDLTGLFRCSSWPRPSSRSSYGLATFAMALVTALVLGFSL